MISQQILQSLAQKGDQKMVLVVVDGLGGLPHRETGYSELETANIPNLDRLAANGMTGLSIPVAQGITPGSGPGHLALFGYDPVSSNIGRGALSALGIGLPLAPEDVAIRINFCTVDSAGNVSDRRAGRIPTELNAELVRELADIKIEGLTFDLATESQHRAVLVLRGRGMSPLVQETDPQRTGVPPLPPDALIPDAELTSEYLKEFLVKVTERIGACEPANFIVMRGYAGLPDLKPISELYSIRPACVASYPMYKGLATAAGMTVLETGDTLDGQISTLRDNWKDFDYFFFHYKYTDSFGEDGDFDGKVGALEEIDAAIPAILDLEPEAIVVAGDHSSPAMLSAHSWHPVPFALLAKSMFPDAVAKFTERACAQGDLGTFPAQQTFSLMLGYAGRLAKFGA